MLEGGGNFPFAGFVQPGEPLFKSGRLFDIEDFQSHDGLGLPVAGFVELRHRPVNGFAQQLETPTHIDLAALQPRIEFPEEFHLS